MAKEWACFVLLCYPFAPRALPAAEAPAPPVVLRISGMTGGNILPEKEPRTVDEKAERAVLEDFQRRYPHVRFDSSTGLRIEGPAKEAGVLMALAGGSAGEVLYVNFRTLDQFVRQDFLHPLDAYLIDWVRRQRGLAEGAAVRLDDIDPLEIGIHPRIWEVICRPGEDGKKHVYALPYRLSVKALIYRKDLFRAAGLDPARPPQTWDELLEYAERLTDPRQGIYGFAMDSGAYHFTNFLWQAGSEIVEETSPGVWRVAFDNDRAVEALRFVRRLLTRRKTALHPSTGEPVSQAIACRKETTRHLDAAFEERRCAMMFKSTEELMLSRGSLAPEVMGMAALPAGPAGRANELNAAMWGINAQIRSEAQRDAAWAFILHQGSEEARAIKTRVFVEAGYAPFVNPAWLEKFGYREYLGEVPREWFQANAEAFRWGRPEPYGKNCQMIYLELRQPLDEVLLDRRAAEKAAEPPGTAAYEEDTRALRAALSRAAAKTDAKLLGVVQPQRLARQRTVAWVAVLAIALAFLVGLARFLRNFQASADPFASHMAGARHWRYHAQAWLFLAVAVVSIGVWSYYPLARGSLMAFQDYRVLGGGDWAGLDNFIDAWNQEDFWTGVRVTFLYVALSLGFGFFVPIALALLLHEVPRGKVFFRILYYLPAVISGLIAMFLWKAFYDPSAHGMLNGVLAPLGTAAPKALVAALALFAVILFAGLFHFGFESLRRRQAPFAPCLAAGLFLAAAAAWLGRDWVASMWAKQPPFQWLNDADTALLCVILPGIWAGAGPGCLIYLAALKAIPEEIYEAADLDGAGAWHKVWHVVIPSLKPLIVINFVGAFIGAFHAMQNIFVMSGSGPLKSTHALSLEIWMSAFLYLKFGYATAIAWMLGAFLIGFTVWQLRILREMRFTTAK